MAEPERKEGASARERVYLALREAIVTGRFAIGEFLNEQKLGVELSVSRTPVREALSMLQADGLVSVIPRKGAVVLGVSVKEIHEIMELRVLLETAAARKVLRAELAQDVVCEMRALISQQQDLLGQGDWFGFITVDRDFHLTYVARASNDWLLKFYNSIRDKQMCLGMRAVLGFGQRAAEVIREHQEILQAFVRADPERVEATLLTHIEQTKRAILAGGAE